MTTSRTIAALLGPVCAITGAMILCNLDAFPAIIREIGEHPTIMLLAGYMTFVPGLAIVWAHNRWQAGWPVLITLLGWLFMVVGAIRILFAYRIANLTERLTSSVLPMLPGFGVLLLAVGGFLSFQAWRGERR